MSGIERLYAPPEIGAPGQRRGRERRRDLRLAGLFVLAMAGVAVGAVALLRPGLLGSTYLVNAYFADATGLATGMPVLQGGYAIGLVDAVVPLFPGRDADAANCPLPGAGPDGTRPVHLPCFRARLRIAGDWPIPADSRALVGSAGLLQGAAIKIELGRAAERLADGGRVIETGRETDLMAQLATLTDSLQALVSETIAPTLASIQQQVRAIEALIGSKESGEDGLGAGDERLAGALASVQRLAAGIESVVDPAQLTRILGSIEEVSVNLREASAGLTSGTTELRAAVRRYGELAGDLRQVVEKSEPDVTSSLDDAQYLLQEMAATLGPILANIEDATRNLAALARDLRANPAVILRGRETEDPSPWPR